MAYVRDGRGRRYEETYRTRFSDAVAPYTADADASLDRFEQEIEGLEDFAAGGRLEDALAFARGASSQAVARTGMDPNSLQAAQLQTNTQADVMQQAFRNEAEVQLAMKQARAGLFGQLSQARMAQQGQMAQQAMMLEEFQLREEQADLQKELALAQMQLAQFANPTWRRLMDLNKVYGLQSSGVSPMVASAGGIGTQQARSQDPGQTFSVGRRSYYGRG